MSGDYSRHRFDARNDYAGVWMQQGRVQLDADWNEWAELLDRRMQLVAIRAQEKARLGTVLAVARLKKRHRLAGVMCTCFARSASRTPSAYRACRKAQILSIPAFLHWARMRSFSS